MIDTTVDYFIIARLFSQSNDLGPDPFTSLSNVPKFDKYRSWPRPNIISNSNLNYDSFGRDRIGFDFPKEKQPNSDENVGLHYYLSILIDDVFLAAGRTDHTIVDIKTSIGGSPASELPDPNRPVGERRQTWKDSERQLRKMADDQIFDYIERIQSEGKTYQLVVINPHGEADVVTADAFIDPSTSVLFKVKDYTDFYADMMHRVQEYRKQVLGFYPFTLISHLTHNVPSVYPTGTLESSKLLFNKIGFEDRAAKAMNIHMVSRAAGWDPDQFYPEMTEYMSVANGGNGQTYTNNVGGTIDGTHFSADAHAFQAQLAFDTIQQYL